MYNNITFIGGIHGVGKGTCCDRLSEQTKFKHLTSSDVLRWNEIKEDTRNKNVSDINFTQERLIAGLREIIESRVQYILDGHFCLWNSTFEVEKIASKTFQDILPRAIAVVTRSPSEIQKNIEKRDGKVMDIQSLHDMQEVELDHAKHISDLIKVPFFEIKTDDTRDLYNFLTN